MAAYKSTKSTSKKTKTKKRQTKKHSSKVKYNKSVINGLLIIGITVAAVLIFVPTLSDYNYFKPQNNQSPVDVVETNSQKPQTSSNSVPSKPINDVSKTDSAKPGSSRQELQEDSSDLETEQLVMNILKDAEYDLNRLRQKKSEEKADNSSRKDSVSNTDSQTDALDSFFPQAKNSPCLAIVIDDGGNSSAQVKKFLDLKFPLTVAVLPKLSESALCGKLVRQAGKELMLHQPMQAVNLNANPGPGAITPQMSLTEIEALLKENMAEVGPVKGINNHEGSLITEDENRIAVVMHTAFKEGVYFMDSRTSAASRVSAAALSLDMPYYKRDIFLDNVKTKENVLAELKKGTEIANRNGYCIMIGHAWSSGFLPQILEECYHVLLKKGYKFTTVSGSGGLIRP